MINSLFAASSSVSRETLKYQVNLPLTGFAHSLMFSSAIEFSYFLSKDQNIGIKYIEYDSPKVYEDTYRGEVLEIFYKKFNGNSFYVKPLVFYRNMDIDEKEGTDYVFSDFGVGISIGNQWQWSNFTIGCDWVGVNSRLATLDYKDSKNSERVFFSKGYGFTANLLNLYIGYSF